MTTNPNSASTEETSTYTTTAGVTIHMPAVSLYDVVLKKIRLHPGYEDATMEVKPQRRNITVRTPANPLGESWFAMRDANFKRIMHTSSANESMEETLGLTWADVSTLTHLLIPADDFRWI